MSRRSRARSGIAVRVEVAGPLDHPRQQGGFGQRELREIFGEVNPRRFAEAVDAERAVASEVNLVGVILEDLLLGQLALQVDR